MLIYICLYAPPGMQMAEATAGLLRKCGKVASIEFMPMVLDFVTHRLGKYRPEVAYSSFISGVYFVSRVEQLTGPSTPPPIALLALLGLLGLSGRHLHLMCVYVCVGMYV